MEHRLRKKQLNSDTNAGKQKIKKNIFLQKKKGKKRRTRPRKRKRKGGKKEEKKGGNKEASKRCTSRDGPKKFFFGKNVKRNRDEIEAQKKTDFEHPTMKMRENDRK